MEPNSPRSFTIPRQRATSPAHAERLVQVVLSREAHCVATGQHASSGINREDIVRRARDLLQSNRPLAALSLLRTVPRASSTDKLSVQLALLHAHSVNQLGLLDQAAVAWRRVAALVPQHDMAPIRASQMMQQVGEQAAAVSYLKLTVEARPQHTPFRMALALALSAQGELDAACAQFSEAAQLGNSEGLYALRMCQRQQKDRTEQARLTELSRSVSPQISPRPIRRVSKLSFERFFKEHAQARVPVIITDGAVPRWTTNHVVELCGRQQAALKKQTVGSGSWAKLESVDAEPGTPNTIAGFVDAIRDGRTNGSYLFDLGIPKYCPALMTDFVVPKYFSQDFLKRMPPMAGGTMDRYWEQWPALFLGPRGSGSGLHIDAIESHFYMALLEGRKRWAVYLPNATAALAPNHLTNHLEADALHPDYTRWPLLQYVPHYECVLQPGELIFIPAGSAHQVENLENTLAVSGNYIDGSNWHDSMAEVAANAQRPDGTDGVLESRHVLQHWKEDTFDATMDMEPRDLLYSQTFPLRSRI